MNNLCFVVDNNNNQLDPTKINKGWYLIRKKRATLISKYPMVIKLNKVVDSNDINKDKKSLGIDDGSKTVGLAIVQEGKTHNKVLFKAELEQRQDVKKKLEVRKGYRQFRRYNKRYRKPRFNNRKNSKKLNRVAPSILQKRQVIIRFVKLLKTYINFNNIYLEDVKIDIRVFTDNTKLFGKQYQLSNRLDENLRLACIKRDSNTCQLCNKSNIKMEVHHIIPRRLNGSDTINNLICLCSKCHSKISNNELSYVNQFIKIINAKPPVNFRHLHNIPKTHANDAIAICGLPINDLDIRQFKIKPIRRKSKAKTDKVLKFKHRDLVCYTYKNGDYYEGYVTALYPDKLALNFQSETKHCKKVNAKKCKLLWSFTNFYWF